MKIVPMTIPVPMIIAILIQALATIIHMGMYVDQNAADIPLATA